MSQETKKIEKKAEQAEQEAKATELSDKDLDQVAGGGIAVGDSLAPARPPIKVAG